MTADHRIDDILHTVRQIRIDHLWHQKELRAMSDSFAQELTAQRAALDNLKTAVGAVAQRVSDLAAQLAAAAGGGADATAEELAAMASVASEIQADADALVVAATPAP